MANETYYQHPLDLLKKILGEKDESETQKYRINAE